jgi:hypothetical protein
MRGRVYPIIAPCVSLSLTALQQHAAGFPGDETRLPVECVAAREARREQDGLEFGESPGHRREGLPQAEAAPARNKAGIERILEEIP